MSVRKDKSRSQRNYVISCVIAVIALVVFAFMGRDSSSGEKKVTPQVKTAATQPSPTPSSKVMALPPEVQTSVSKPNIPANLPEDLQRSLSSPPPDLPEDLKAQLNAPPPELPEDLKQQLMNPVRELPPDLKAQLEAPPPELPDDIKRALKTPPRVVTLEEVNTPPDPGL